MDDGVIKVRTVRRKGTAEERWETVRIDAMKGVAWEPVPGSETFEIGTRVKLKDETEVADGPRIPEGIERPVRNKRWHIRAEDIDKYDPSEDCEGCRRAVLGLPQRAIPNGAEKGLRCSYTGMEIQESCVSLTG